MVRSETTFEDTLYRGPSTCGIEWYRIEMFRSRFLGLITDHLESVSADPDITDHSVKSINSSIYSVTVAAFIYLMIPLTQH